ncbi:MAG: hypothetical protein WC358_00985 [Ignavibacteria bacterium]
MRLSESPLFLIDKEFIEIKDKGNYGDLYILNLIDNFKIPLPEELPPFKLSGKNSNPNDADILIYGDSFFDGKARGKQLPEKLYDTLKKKVFFNDRISRYLLDLEKQNYSSKRKKIFLLEIAQYNIPKVFSNLQPLEEKKPSKLDEYRIIFPIGYEKKYLYLLQHSILTYKMHTTIVNFMFDYLGCIPPITPVYIKDPPWLFENQDLDETTKISFYYKYSNEELQNICNNIEDLSEKLYEKYNLKLVFLPIPNKYTFYHKLLNNDTYNNFIPALCNELKKRNIGVIEIYEEFLKSDKILYYPTDTHYNQDGDNIVLKKILEYLNSNTDLLKQF